MGETMMAANNGEEGQQNKTWKGFIRSLGFSCKKQSATLLIQK